MPLLAMAQPYDQMQTTTNFVGTDLIAVQTNSAGGAGQKFLRAMEMDDFLSALTRLDGWSSVGGSATNAQPPTTALTNASAFLSGGFSNRVSITDSRGFLTNAYKRIFVDTNQSHILHLILETATDGDTVETGAGTFNVGTNILKVPVGVTFDFSKSIISSTAGLNTNGPIVQPGTRSIINCGVIDQAASASYFQAAFGFYSSAANLNYNHAATNFIVRNLIATNGQTDVVFMQQSNYFSGDFYHPTIVGKWDSFAQTTPAAGTRTNFIRVFGGSIKSDMFGATEPNTIGQTAKPIRIGNGTLELYGVDVIGTNGATVVGIALTGTEPTAVYAIGGRILVAGTNSAYKFDNSSAPTTQKFHIINAPVVSADGAPGSAPHYYSGSFSNLLAAGALTVSGAATMGSSLDVIGITTVEDTVIGGTIDITDLTASRVLMINGDNRMTHVAAGGAGEFLKSDGTSAVPAGGAGLTTNANQFSGVPLAIISRASISNAQHFGTLTVTNPENGGSVGYIELSDSGIFGANSGNFSVGNTNLITGLTFRNSGNTINPFTEPNASLGSNAPFNRIYGSNVIAGGGIINRIQAHSYSNNTVTVGDNLHINGTNYAHEYTASTNASLVFSNLFLNTPVRLTVYPAIGGAGWALSLNVPAASWPMSNAWAFPTNLGRAIIEVTKVSATQTNLVIVEWPQLLVATGYKTEAVTNMAGGTVTFQSTERKTNYPTGAFTVNCSTDVHAEITNAVGSSYTITLATPVPGTSGTIAFLSDGSARTLTFSCPALAALANGGMVWLSTNGTANSTNILTDANKYGLFAYRVRETHLAGEAPKTNLFLWVKNQTP